MIRSLHIAVLCSACVLVGSGCLLDSSGRGNAGGAGGSSGGAGGTGASGGEGGGAPAVCGDGDVQGKEQCDDAGSTAGDGCGADCVIEAGWACAGEPSACEQTCGDGQLDAGSGEECDDGNVSQRDGCNQGCQVEAGWQCTNPDDGAPTVCTGVCGNGVLQGLEVCDDGDTDGASGCNADCSGPSPGWQCEAGEDGPGSCIGVCGDGLAVGQELCDDGNLSSGDGCDADCHPEAQCGNGVVEPTEACDGAGTPAQCGADCKLTVGSVCSNAIAIAPGQVDPRTGVRTSFQEALDSAALAVLPGEVAPQSCKNNFTSPVLHSYTTGARPSVVTVESLDMLADGTDTVQDTVVWVYRNCPGRSDVDGCDGDSGIGKHGLFRTGYVPALTTLFIVFAGEGDGSSQGPYRLQITEQPVRLFFHEDFGDETNGGLYPLPDTLEYELLGDGGWQTCVEKNGNACEGAEPSGHSGGAFGWARGQSNATTHAVLRTPALDLSGLVSARVDYSYRYVDGVFGTDAGKVEAASEGGAVSGSKTYSSSTSGRETLTLPVSPGSRAIFTYDDGANANAGTFSIDDIHVYGY